MTPYLLMKNSINAKMKQNLTPEQIDVEQSNYRKKANTFFTFGQMDDVEYAEIMVLIDSMSQPKSTSTEEAPSA